MSDYGALKIVEVWQEEKLDFHYQFGPILWIDGPSFLLEFKGYSFGICKLLICCILGVLLQKQSLTKPLKVWVIWCWPGYVQKEGKEEQNFFEISTLLSCEQERENLKL